MMNSSYKKVELHVHLEGTISPALAMQLAARNCCPMPHELIAKDGQSYLSSDFLHFLSVFDVIAGLIKAPQDYYDITYDYLQRSAADDVIYVEMMYSPDHAERMSGIPSALHLDAIQQAIQDAELAFGIVGRILITVVRQFGPDSAIRVARAAAHTPVPCVVGFAMGGDELGFPPQLFQEAFQIAHGAAGLLCTAHTGEFAGPDGIVDALACLPLQRIGHGVRAIESPSLMRLLKERGISLEICPSSNIKFGVFPNLAAHPLPQFFAAGISFSLNSDDPPFIPTTVAREYALVQQAYAYTDAEMTTISRMAIDAAFVDETVKVALRAQL